jgi:Mg-chelatase subunit ChlD
VAGWIKRAFTSPGLTQIPPGPSIGALRRRHEGGVVMLCIDVSGSMAGKRILEAVRGAERFVSEAVEARYQVGIMLWNTSVVDLAEPTSDGNGAMKLLRRTDRAGGGNNLIGPLERCHDILDQFKDAPDRVVALFGDGDLSPKERVLRKVAQMKEENIRFVTRGLGKRAAAEFGEISSEEPSSASIDDVDHLADGIGQMGASLKKKRKQA